MPRLGAWLLPVLIGIIGPRCAVAAPLTDFTDYSLHNSSGQVVLPGRLFIPPQAVSNPATPRPLMIFLHGGGASGTDNVAQIEQTPDQMLAEAKLRGAFVYVPQTATNWSSPALIDSVAAMVERALVEHNVDPDRLYATGYSNGGGGTWSLLSRNPGRFAAAIAISGVTPTVGFDAANLLGTAIFALHARDDATIPVARSRVVVSDILAAAGELAPAYPPAGSPLNLLVYNPNFAFHRELAASAPPGSTVEFAIQRGNLDLIYFESAAGGHTGMFGALFAPPTYDWLFAHTLAVPEPGSMVFAAAGLLSLSTSRRRRIPRRYDRRPAAGRTKASNEHGFACRQSQSGQ